VQVNTVDVSTASTLPAAVDVPTETWLAAVAVTLRRDEPGEPNIIRVSSDVNMDMVSLTINGHWH